MKSKHFLIAGGVLATIAILIYANFLVGDERFAINKEEEVPQNVEKNSEENCKPAFADGGGPYYLPNSPFRENLAPQDSPDNRIKVRGRLFQKDCKTPVPNAVLDIWHANGQGEYENNFYRGKIRTDQNGTFAFATIVPLGYGEGTGYRPPHIHFKVFVEDREVITSQMFFPDVRGQEGFDEAYIVKLDGQIVTHDIILP